MSSVLAKEQGTVRKKWTGRLPVALLYANTYPVAVSNLGYQLVYTLLNRLEEVVCERFVYPADGGPLVLIKETTQREFEGGTQIFIYAPDQHDFFALLLENADLARPVIDGGEVKPRSVVGNQRRADFDDEAFGVGEAGFVHASSLLAVSGSSSSTSGRTICSSAS